MSRKIPKEEKIIRKKYLKDCKNFYIKVGLDGCVPNTSARECISLTNKELKYLGIQKRNKVDLRIIGQTLHYPELNSKAFFKILENKYGKLISNRDIKQQTKIKANSIRDQIKDPQYLEFISNYYRNDTDIINNKRKIVSMYYLFKKPKESVLLSKIALDLLRDTHALDKKNGYRNFLEGMVKFQHGENAILEDHNILTNFSTVNVYTNNIVDNEDNKWRVLCLKNFENIKLIKNQNIYIFENLGVYEIFGKKNKDIPIICTSGFYNSASKKLIKMLIENNNKLYYSGDLDPAGIKIADNIIDDYPQVNLWYMDLETYEKYKKWAIKQPKEQSEYIIKNKNLRILKNTILKENKIINQERIKYKIISTT